MPSSAELQAELKVRELEEALVAAKADGSVSAEQKLELREARAAHRELRATRLAADGEARPDNVAASAAVQEG